MRHTICCIDDKIPASKFPVFFDETKLLDEQVIRFLLNNKESEWEDSVVRGLFMRLLTNEEWSVTAFTAPSFFENYNSDVVFSPDVIVFDWDYNLPPGSDNSATSLLRILQTSYAIVFILSGTDNIEDIHEVLKAPEYTRFGKRLEVVPKEADNSVDFILNTFNERADALFAYKYGCDIVRRSNKAINSILSEISLLSVPGFISAIGKGDAQGYFASSADFIDAMIPRFRKALCCVEMDAFRAPLDIKPNIEEIREVWKYRLYGDNEDDRVAMGDIVLNEIEDKYYVVFSSDCHMNHFWKKNGGFISLIPLLLVDELDTKRFISKFAANNFQISSLTSSQWPITILPAVPIDSERLVDFAISPKNIRTVLIEKQQEGQEGTLRYKYWPGYKKISTILDPFKSPLMQFLLNNITGYGCPDFPVEMKDYISKIVKLP